MTPGSPQEWAASTDGAGVLPARHAHEAAAITAPLAVLDVVELTPRSWLSVVADAGGRRFVVPLVLGADGVRRARAGDAVAADLLALLAGAPAHGQRAGSGFTVVGLASEAVSGERALDVDQTNDSVVVGERAVVKFAVRVEDGPHPAPRALHALAAAGFTGTPQPWGLVTWHGGAGEPVLVASAVDLLPGAVDGWTWAVADARAFAEAGLEEAAADDDAASRWGGGPASAIGGLVADLHLALAGDASAEPASARDAARWVDDAQREVSDALRAVGGAPGRRLAVREHQLRAALRAIAEVEGSPLTTVHGDLHVGQLLRWRPPGATADAHAVIDFDGNPVVTPRERMAAQPAAVDVAGLLQSYDHVARVVAHRTPGADAARLGAWVAQTQPAVLAAYRAGLAAAGREELLAGGLVRAFRLRQVVREHLYAARHLPRWGYVPDGALTTLLPHADTSTSTSTDTPAEEADHREP